MLAAVAMGALFVAFLHWAVTPDSLLTDFVRRAIDVGPHAFRGQWSPRR